MSDGAEDTKGNEKKIPNRRKRGKKKVKSNEFVPDHPSSPSSGNSQGDRVWDGTPGPTDFAEKRWEKTPTSQGSRQNRTSSPSIAFATKQAPSTSREKPISRESPIPRETSISRESFVTRQLARLSTSSEPGTGNGKPSTSHMASTSHARKSLGSEIGVDKDAKMKFDVDSEDIVSLVSGSEDEYEHKETGREKVQKEIPEYFPSENGIPIPKTGYTKPKPKLREKKVIYRPQKNTIDNYFPPKAKTLEEEQSDESRDEDNLT